ncbi:hypothetical protein ACFVH0_15840 [Streptomyces sp. NPDC127117]|uniref:hypothetical protein n=1 Tax=Streptomyces sp. NPDC127117 TaxID=3345368 RepID=UPI00362866B3
MPNDAKRLFYRLPVDSFAGESIIGTELVVRETFAYNYSKQPVEFRRIEPLPRRLPGTTRGPVTTGSIRCGP